MTSEYQFNDVTPFHGMAAEAIYDGIMNEARKIEDLSEFLRHIENSGRKADLKPTRLLKLVLIALWTRSVDPHPLTILNYN